MREGSEINLLCPNRQHNRHRGACPRGLVTASQTCCIENLSPPRGLFPWSDDYQRAVTRGSAGTSPAEAIGRRVSVTGRQSASHRDKPGGVITAKSCTS